LCNGSTAGFGSARPCSNQGLPAMCGAVRPLVRTPRCERGETSSILVQLPIRPLSRKVRRQAATLRRSGRATRRGFQGALAEQEGAGLLNHGRAATHAQVRSLYAPPFECDQKCRSGWCGELCSPHHPQFPTFLVRTFYFFRARRCRCINQARTLGPRPRAVGGSLPPRSSISWVCRRQVAQPVLKAGVAGSG
jgi:hypothetical protein